MSRSWVNSASPYEEQYGFSRALRVGDRVFVAGTAPIPQDGSSPPDSAFDQAMLCFTIIADALDGVGAKRRHVVTSRMFITDAAFADEVGRAHANSFGDASPAATMVVVSRLLEPSWKVEVEVEAIVD